MQSSLSLCTAEGERGAGQCNPTSTEGACLTLGVRQRSWATAEVLPLTLASPSPTGLRCFPVDMPQGQTLYSGFQLTSETPSASAPEDKGLGG